MPQWTNCRPRQKRKDALLDAPLLFFFFFLKHTALRGEIAEIHIPSHQHFQTSPWTFTLDFAVWSFDAAAFYMNQWLYDRESCLPSGLVYSDMPHIRDVQISLIHTHNILLNQLMFVWSVAPFVRISYRIRFKPMRSVEKVDVTLRLQFPQADGGRRPRGQRHLCSLYSGNHALLVSPPTGKNSHEFCRVLRRRLHCAVPLPIRHCGS